MSSSNRLHTKTSEHSTFIQMKRYSPDEMFIIRNPFYRSYKKII